MAELRICERLEALEVQEECCRDLLEYLEVLDPGSRPLQTLLLSRLQKILIHLAKVSTAAFLLLEKELSMSARDDEEKNTPKIAQQKNVLPGGLKPSSFSIALHPPV